MKGRIVRIDKTARQKGAPSWLKELIYVDEVDDAKPAREGGTRSDSLLKANATHPTTCDGGPKGIATYPSNSEGNVLNEPAETGEKNFDTCNDELEIAAESECDLVFFSLRRIAEKISSAVAKTLDWLFLGLMDRSMGETNFFVVTMMGLACSKVISAQFFEAEAFGELNLLAFLIAICTAAVFTASKNCPQTRLPPCAFPCFRHLSRLPRYAQFAGSIYRKSTRSSRDSRSFAQSEVSFWAARDI